MILADTGALFAAMFSDQPFHQACRRVVEDSDRPVLSPFVLAELDYMVLKLAGVDAELELLEQVGEGAYELVCLTESQVARARAIAARHRDLGIGLTDASIVVLAQDRGIRDVLTLDERHFRVLAKETPLRLLPADLPERRRR